jgi:hypothetical protein
MPIEHIVTELKAGRDRIDATIKALAALTLASRNNPKTQAQAHYLSSGPEEDRGSATSLIAAELSKA